LRLTNLVTTNTAADVLPQETNPDAPVAELTTKPVQDRFVSETVNPEKPLAAPKSTKTAEALVPTGGVSAAGPAK
jgi:hypothetical protein